MFADFAQSAGVEGCKREDIQWVLTVPAIWTDGAKQIMRQGALCALNLVLNFGGFCSCDTGGFVRREEL